MQEKHRIILILVVGVLVGALVIAASLSTRDGVSQDTSPLDRASLAGEDIIIKLGLLPRRTNVCIPGLKQIDGAKATWALEQNRTNNSSGTALQATNAATTIQK